MIALGDLSIQYNLSPFSNQTKNTIMLQVGRGMSYIVKEILLTNKHF